MGLEFLPRPLHPLIIHFPIGLLFAAGGILAYLCFRKEDLWLTFRFLFSGGMAGFLLAMLSGTIDEGWAVQTETAHEMVERHELMAYVNLTLFAGLGAWMYLRPQGFSSRELIAYTVAFWITLGTLAYGAHIGGDMVYETGVAVETK